MIRSHESLAYNSRQILELKKLVAQGEGQKLEFKRKASHPEKIIREMIAFANSQGGILLVGVGDDGSIPGLKFPDDESYVIQKEIKTCWPALSFKEIFIPIGNSRTIIQYEIPESSKKPHYILLNDSSKESYVRVADKSIKASREVREIAKRQQRNKNIRFHYGEHERMLMQYLDANPTITLKEFMNVSALNRFNVSKKLILLVLADVLRVTPSEKGDLYSLAFRTNKRNGV